MTILNIATILMNMKSSWFSDSISLILDLVICATILFTSMPLFTQPCSGGWHWPVPKEGHQEDVQEEDPEEVQGQAFPEGES